MEKYIYLLIGTLATGVSGLQAQNTPVAGQPVNAVPVTVPPRYSNTVVNYIRSWEPSMPTSDINVVVSESRTLSEVKQGTQYFDGLGRPLQTVQKAASSQGRDLVAPVIYDTYGREQYKYLPYVQQSGNNNDGKFKMDPFAEQQTFYQNNALNPGVAGESVYFSQVEYEASPLNRVLKIYAPGNSWAQGGGNRPVMNQYLANAATDSVHIWRISAAIPASSGTYAANQLYKNVVVDEAGNQVIEYKDKEGKVILKKLQLAISPGTAHVGWLCTYYVYDDLGNLVFVIPPKAVEAVSGNWTIGADVAAELCFSYQYDNRNRMVMKQVPGAGPVHMVYDTWDRLVFTQDAVQRAKSTPEWLVTFYDELNRPVMTAIYKSASTREALQQGMNTASGSGTISYAFPAKADLYVDKYMGESKFTATQNISFTGNFDSGAGAVFDAAIEPGGSSGTTAIAASNPLPGISSADLTPLTYAYYDNYNYTGKLPYESSDISKPQAGANPYAESLPGIPSTMTNGLVTGSMVRVLGTDQWLATSSYYDDKGRTIQMVSENNVGGREVVTSLYDFNGKVLSSYVNHKNPHSALTPEIRVLTTNLYDAAGRLVQVEKKINDDAEQVIAANSYDELGQLRQKRLGVTGTDTQLDSVTYTYNIRGWVSGINRAYVNNPNAAFNWFGQELSYDQGFTANQYNGNISGIKWKSKSDGISRAYGYNYDKVNRLTVADFTQQNNSSSLWTKDQVDFSVSNLLYDANGNINSMTQKGMVGNTISTIDQLTYSYQANSNKLLAVADPNNTTEAKLGDFNNGANTGDDYSHDANGNLVTDQNKNINSITYNHLNLPSQITITGKGVISYLYDASGNKLKKTVVDNTVSPSKTIVTDYVAGFVYRQDSLEYTGHEEGRIRPVYRSGQPVTYAYDYFEKDHLGNVRVVLGTQTEENVYAATMETSAAEKENALFSNIDATRSTLPAGYPEDATTNPNTYVAKLNRNAAKIGPSLVLRVMAGDTIQAVAKAFYQNTGASQSAATAEEMVIAAISAFSTGNLTEGVHAALGVNAPIANNFTGDDYQVLKNTDPLQNLSDKPKAYLNYVLFDDQFKMVNENSGVRQVQGSPNVIQPLETGSLVIKKTGFIYIYSSNESAEDVFFDNLVVVHNSGPLLEETHYYPFGLTMAGISANALKGNSYTENRLKYNGKELQSGEFANGSGLEWYDYGARMYDQQLGRFFTQDRYAENYYPMTPYQYGANNPVKNIDVNGDSIIVTTSTGQRLYYGNTSEGGYGFYSITGTDSETGIPVQTLYIGNDKFVNQVSSALGRIGISGKEGQGLVNELSSSENVFAIQSGSTNQFNGNPAQAPGEYAAHLLADPSISSLQPVPGGGGGTITWDPNGANVWTVGGKQDNNPVSNLAHEMFHGRDANRGVSYDKQYPSGLYQGLSRNEWQASYKENLIRAANGWPIREYYRSAVEPNGNPLGGAAPRILDSKNQPIKPSWMPANW
ncbi:DUF6443 domain-containing protein [Chitinophaga tropicalis]|uniref:DUF6443 domain-containing protein n=1 Tax=Chitinophaga tropicalis TaxID=2683588 RepID=UPI0018E058D6|nr:DUF6443 domain-containing protein [Chitinophaga tropicalis]